MRHTSCLDRATRRYKLFHDPVLQETVLSRLKQQFVESGLCSPDARVQLGLVHAHATPGNVARLTAHFGAESWLLFGPDWIRAGLQRLAEGSWENSTAAAVAKLLLRPGPAHANSFTAPPSRQHACANSPFTGSSTGEFFMQTSLAVALSATLLCSACVSMGTNYDQHAVATLQPGMARDEVIARLGKPNSVALVFTPDGKLEKTGQAQTNIQ